MSESIGDRIKNLREKKEWSQRELAERVGINYSVVNRIEVGKRPVKDHEISKFADVFSVSTDYLVGKGNSVKPQHNSYDSLEEINKLVKEFNIEQLGFFDIEKWKNFTPEDIDELRRHFEWVAQKAKERNEEK